MEQDKEKWGLLAEKIFALCQEQNQLQFKTYNK